MGRIPHPLEAPYGGAAMKGGSGILPAFLDVRPEVSPVAVR